MAQLGHLVARTRVLLNAQTLVHTSRNGQHQACLDLHGVGLALCRTPKKSPWNFYHTRVSLCSAATLTGETGTYVYMAPEMIRHELYTTKADVYSWGVLLAECLAQRPPYEGLYLTPVQVLTIPNRAHPDDTTEEQYHKSFLACLLAEMCFCTRSHAGQALLDHASKIQTATLLSLKTMKP